MSENNNQSNLLEQNPKQEPQVLTGKGGLIVLDQSEDLPGTQRFCNQFFFFFFLPPAAVTSTIVSSLHNEGKHSTRRQMSATPSR